METCVPQETKEKIFKLRTKKVVQYLPTILILAFQSYPMQIYIINVVVQFLLIMARAMTWDMTTPPEAQFISFDFVQWGLWIVLMSIGLAGYVSTAKTWLNAIMGGVFMLYTLVTILAKKPFTLEMTPTPERVATNPALYEKYVKVHMNVTGLLAVNFLVQFVCGILSGMGDGSSGTVAGYVIAYFPLAWLILTMGLIKVYTDMVKKKVEEARKGNESNSANTNA